MNDLVWIFGGVGETGLLSDVYTLDLRARKWSQKDTFGAKPTKRQGHSSILHGSNIVIVGGCVYDTKTCFSETYMLNTVTLWWTKLLDDG